MDFYLPFFSHISSPNSILLNTFSLFLILVLFSLLLSSLSVIILLSYLPLLQLPPYISPPSYHPSLLPPINTLSSLLSTLSPPSYQHSLPLSYFFLISILQFLFLSSFLLLRCIIHGLQTLDLLYMLLLLECSILHWLAADTVLEKIDGTIRELLLVLGRGSYQGSEKREDKGQKIKNVQQSAG